MSENTNKAEQASGKPRPRTMLDYADLLLIERDLTNEAFPHRFSVTTNAGQLADGDKQLAIHTQKAWRLFGALVFADLIHVDFSDPEWALDVKRTIDTLTEQIVAMSSFG